MTQQYEETLVSIIMPCHNGMPYISEAIESVLAQTYENWELLIVDDFSSDDSVKTIESFVSKYPKIKLISKNNRCEGAHHSRNLAIKASRGRFIAFLDCDDLWLPNKLDIQIGL